MGVKRDLYYAKWLCRKRSIEGYSKIYFETNEELDKLFEKVDFTDKSVLSVLSSSDQLFKLKSHNIKNIDTFDKNKLTYYYFYIRMWTIKYMKELYPTALIYNDYDWIQLLLLSVKPETIEEKDALFFWQSLLNKKVNFSRMFIVDPEKGLDFSRDIEMNNLPSTINYSKLNLFKKQKFEKLYDIAVISNILEWSIGDSRFLEIISSNLTDLLKENGIVLCSKVTYNNNINGVNIKSALSDNFELCDNDNLGYVYIKR